MTGAVNTRGLIIDAVALIDFRDAALHVLGLISSHIGRLYVATSTLAEVRDIVEEDCASLGLTAVEPNPDQKEEAARAVGALSFPDNVCLILARDNGWTCITNDKRFRRECEAAGVSVLWGLQTLVLLVEASVLKPAEAKGIAIRIHQLNPQYITKELLHRFCQRVGCSIK